MVFVWIVVVALLASSKMHFEDLLSREAAAIVTTISFPPLIPGPVGDFNKFKNHTFLQPKRVIYWPQSIIVLPG